MQEVSLVVESDLIFEPNTHQPRGLHLDEYSHKAGHQGGLAIFIIQILLKRIPMLWNE